MKKEENHASEKQIPNKRISLMDGKELEVALKERNMKDYYRAREDDRL